MLDIAEIKQNAKKLREEGCFEEACEPYGELWDNHRDKCNKWDMWGYATCLRKVGRSNEALEICRELYSCESKFQQGKNLYAWCIYDTEIKKDLEQIKNEEEVFFKAVTAIQTLTTQDQYSPYSKAIFAVIDYLNKAKNVYPAKDILNWLDELDHTSLSEEPFQFIDDRGRSRELQSEKEKWYATKTKCLQKLNNHDECILFCQEALEKFSKFHYFNDVWFKRRIALSKAQLGDKVKAAEELEEILKRKKDWFIQFELAGIYHDLQDNQKALKYAVESALNFGKVEYKWELFYLLAQILIAEGRIDEAKEHLEFTAAIRTENDWKIPDELNMLLSKYEIDISQLDASRAKQNKLTKFWQDERYSDQPVKEGKIKKLLPNGKAGFILCNDGNDYYFKVSDFKADKRILKHGLSVSFSIADSFDKKKNMKTKAAVNIKSNE